MILSELAQFYGRCIEVHSLSPEGFQWRPIPFIFVLSTNGDLCAIEDTRTIDSPGKRFLVPASVKRTRGIQANLLWDTAEYVLGIALSGGAERARARVAAFEARLSELDLEDEGVRAVSLFVARFHREDRGNSPLWPEIIRTNAVLSFRLTTDDDLVCQRPAVVERIRRQLTREKSVCSSKDRCLVTGGRDSIELIHPWIIGVRGTDHLRGRIVSFGQQAFESYGKAGQFGLNAPVGKSAAFAYATALNHLLRSDSRCRVPMGKITCVFWAEKASEFEPIFSRFLTGESETAGEEFDDLDSRIRVLQKFAGVGRGRFFVLGLAPNGPRISVNCWITTTVRNMAKAMIKHCRELRVQGAHGRAPFVSIREAIGAMSLSPDSERGAGNFIGDLLRAVLLGQPYSEAAYRGLLRTLGRRGRVDLASAALAKAHVNRASYARGSYYALLPDSLDAEMREASYLWGRFFALCQHIEHQTVSRWAPSLGIRYYKIVSVRPWALFTRLYRDAVWRIRRNGLQDVIPESCVMFDEIAESIAGLETKSKAFSAEEQGRFAVGYYQQLQEIKH